jgi:bisphosphoglycerate-independent phosphoglycerate mutase (AlkP superfamily)
VPLGGDPNVPRSGDHTVESRLWLAGPLVEHGGAIRDDANVLDIAPTILDFLDVPLPAELDGRPLVAAAAAAAE